MDNRILIASLCWILMGANSCSTPSLNVRLYRVNNELGGIHRGQTGEVIGFTDAEGYYCTSPDGMRQITEFVGYCRRNCGR
jgi:hypothetical protein